MRKLLLFFIFVMLNIGLANAQDDWFYSSRNLLIGLNVSSGADISPKVSDYSVDYIKVNL